MPFAFEPPLLSGLAKARGPAWLRSFGGASNERDQALPRIPAILFLRSEAVGINDENPIRSDPIGGQTA
ncbi:MAG: hypothetical protein HW378_621 [Anaerolineales bacterium]|nr:hypothetical protein [Anaerolineales bacterium]